MEKKKGSVRRETNAVSDKRVIIVQSRHPKTRHPLSHQLQKARGRRVSRTRNARCRSQSEKFNRPPCKYFLKGTCTKSPCENRHPPECQFYKTKSGCKFGAECSFPHWKVETQPNKMPKKGDDKSKVAIAKSVRQLSCASQDTEPPESSTISRKGTKVLGPIRRLRFTRAAVRQSNIRQNKGPSLGKIQVQIPHQRSPYALKFEDRSPGEIARQERCARGDAWELARKIYKLKQEDKASFYSPSEEWILLAASTINSEEREFVADSGASMHMVSRKDFNKAELETVRIPKNSIMVVTANGEVPAKEEAMVYVRELDLFVTLMLLENTPAVLSLGKLCEDFGYSFHWTNGQKPHLIKIGKKFHRDTPNHVPFVVLGLSTSSSSSSTCPTSSSQETVTDTEIPARRSESTRELISTGEPVA